jgi:MraZ protein
MPRVSALKSEDRPDALPEIVVPVMTGTHFHALDDKGRVIVPAKLRPGLTERFWMMLDENDNVAMYNYTTGRDVLEYCERQMAQNPGDEFIAAAVERITGAAELVVMENDSWRVPVSDVLRFYARIDKEVVTVGVLNKAVMWSRELWEEAQTKRQSPEVRKAQASMLRAAASGIKQLQKPQKEEEEDVKRTGSDRAASTSASDGGRGSRVLTLGQLGR